MQGYRVAGLNLTGYLIISSLLIQMVRVGLTFQKLHRIAMEAVLLPCDKVSWSAPAPPYRRTFGDHCLSPVVVDEFGQGNHWRMTVFQSEMRAMKAITISQ